MSTPATTKITFNNLSRFLAFPPLSTLPNLHHPPASPTESDDSDSDDSDSDDGDPNDSDPGDSESDHDNSDGDSDSDVASICSADSDSHSRTHRFPRYRKNGGKVPNSDKSPWPKGSKRLPKWPQHRQVKKAKRSSVDDVNKTDLNKGSVGGKETLTSKERAEIYAPFVTASGRRTARWGRGRNAMRRTPFAGRRSWEARHRRGGDDDTPPPSPPPNSLSQGSCKGDSDGDDDDDDEPQPPSQPSMARRSVKVVVRRNKMGGKVFCKTYTRVKRGRRFGRKGSRSWFGRLG